MALHVSPEEARRLTPKQLARRAFNKAVDRLEADRDAGKISPADALSRFKALRTAYQTRKDDLELAAFLASHGLANIMQGAR